jgi:hypothetical protein
MHYKLKNFVVKCSCNVAYFSLAYLFNYRGSFPEIVKFSARNLLHGSSKFLDQNELKLTYEHL